MKKVISSEKNPIKMWLDDIESGALEQAKNLANLPFAFKHIALMPDCHSGYGMPIGGVLATKNVIVPGAVGVDIACGMCAVKTSLTDISLSVLAGIRNDIMEMIPVGFNHQKTAQEGMPVCQIDRFPIVSANYNKASYQIGTLGGGNHFQEVQKGSDGHIWIMVHSGSRNLGYQVAKHYNKVARDLNKKWFSSVPDRWELAFLPFDSNEGQSYFAEMNYCVNFALANRQHMLDTIQHIFVHSVPSVSFDKPINIAHNYAAMENHFGQNVLVHRKGATRARKGELGIIPGSQGTASYIVRGLGNPQSFCSCSHGAGRKMGRKQAKRTLDLATEQAKLEGILHSVDSVDSLDEAPGSYKDIDVVMENQKDLVEIVVELKPLAVVKG
jgi:tRNA-splicing ligase RtcB